MNIFILLLDILFPPRDTELLIRNTNEDALVPLIEPKRLSMNKSYIVALLPYHHPLVSACILETKFNGNKKAARMLGKVLTLYLRHLEKLISPLPYQGVLIPIPLSKKREQSRGYNQILHIFEFIETSFPMHTGLIKRIVHTVPQTSLNGKERRRNLKKAFIVADIPEKTHLYIVVDDVVTTGTTLSVTGRTLSEAQNNPIFLLALAH